MCFKFSTIAEKQKIHSSIQKIKSDEKHKNDIIDRKNMTYLTITIVFSKFTISNLSDAELDEKQVDVVQEIFKDLSKYRGKIIESEAFDEKNTFSILFASQDDAMNFSLKLNDIISYYDDEVQSYGYSISYRAILDSQLPEANQFNVFAFAEKALRTIEINEICATNDFANRYKRLGKLNHTIEFLSKGNYSINKERVELNKINIL